jgi:hypothetical protein
MTLHTLHIERKNLSLSCVSEGSEAFLRLFSTEKHQKKPEKLFRLFRKEEKEAMKEASKTFHDWLRGQRGGGETLRVLIAHDNGQGMTVKQIKGIRNLSAASISRHLNRLWRGGYVIRNAYPDSTTGRPEETWRVSSPLYWDRG